MAVIHTRVRTYVPRYPISDIRTLQPHIGSQQKSEGIHIVCIEISLLSDE